ncbi:uncharacterized protein C8R40DRAFT_1162178 [Lentinula edodes]|uniref:uncharacterized protein n=1 Tax=Lentinula edodes TaxID=5353 RepID=UPI001E8DFB45|nr:uncharacterized protein C8R40DRAFT_1162178 [Lentinula edodes]KAH7872553.1 hypothetical protein C8R40DRAFT_1162178 [Lentinula edodes]
MFLQLLQVPSVADSGKYLDQYSFIDDDFPEYYPLVLKKVMFTPENTVHYQVYSNNSTPEWQSIFPSGGGFLQLGNDGQRVMGLSMFHQLHCLARIRIAMKTNHQTPHVHHCFNYIRQMILCDANPAIEPVIPILGMKSVNAEVPHICNDWSQVYHMATNNYESSTGIQ